MMVSQRDGQGGVVPTKLSQLDPTAPKLNRQKRRLCVNANAIPRSKGSAKVSTHIREAVCDSNTAPYAPESSGVA